MTNTRKDYEPGRGYSRSDWEEVSDNPELTEDELKAARAFSEALPALANKMRKGGRPKKRNAKQAISIRLDPDVIEKFKSTGEGWQTRMNDILKNAEL